MPGAPQRAHQSTRRKDLPELRERHRQGVQAERRRAQLPGEDGEDHEREDVVGAGVRDGPQDGERGPALQVDPRHALDRWTWRRVDRRPVERLVEVTGRSRTLGAVLRRAGAAHFPGASPRGAWSSIGLTCSRWVEAVKLRVACREHRSVNAAGDGYHYRAPAALQDSENTDRSSRGTMATSPSGQRCVIVAGFPRSGTSWLAKGLSFAPGFTYYREPDNYDRVAEAEKRFVWLYLTARDDDAYRNLMTRACAGQMATAFTMRQDPGPLLRLFGGPGRALGERYPFLFFRQAPRAGQAGLCQSQSRLVRRQFPAGPAAVCACATPAASSRAGGGWAGSRDPTGCWRTPASWPTTCSPFADLMRSASGFWERAGALWAATVYVIRRQTPADGGRLIVAYEWLCGDPVGRFQALYRRLGLEWSPTAERFSATANREGDGWAYSLHRAAAQAGGRWRPGLSPERDRRVPPFRRAVRAAVLSRLRARGGVGHGRPPGDARPTPRGPVR